MIKVCESDVELADDGQIHPLKWMTIVEAANYLRVCRDTVERRLVDFDDGPREGKLRSKRFPMARGPRIWGEDVYKLLPHSES